MFNDTSTGGTGRGRAGKSGTASGRNPIDIRKSADDLHGVGRQRNPVVKPRPPQEASYTKWLLQRKESAHGRTEYSMEENQVERSMVDIPVRDKRSDAASKGKETSSESSNSETQASSESDKAEQQSKPQFRVRKSLLRVTTIGTAGGSSTRVRKEASRAEALRQAARAESPSMQIDNKVPLVKSSVVRSTDKNAFRDFVVNNLRPEAARNVLGVLNSVLSIVGSSPKDFCLILQKFLRAMTQDQKTALQLFQSVARGYLPEQRPPEWLNFCKALADCALAAERGTQLSELSVSDTVVQFVAANRSLVL